MFCGAPAGMLQMTSDLHPHANLHCNCRSHDIRAVCVTSMKASGTLAPQRAEIPLTQPPSSTRSYQHEVMRKARQCYSLDTEVRCCCLNLMWHDEAVSASKHDSNWNRELLGSISTCFGFGQVGTHFLEGSRQDLSS